MKIIICDKCKKNITPANIMEWQEVFQHSGCGGYTSKFGDGASYTLDLCDACWHSIAGEYVQYDDAYEQIDQNNQ